MICANEIKDILNNNDPGYLESLARKAQAIKEQFFGRTISLYAPLYLSNFCSSGCLYCGFSAQNKIPRFKLTADEMHREMSFIAGKGIENILLLTGESYSATPLNYLVEAVTIAKKYFSSISLEVHPMEKADYRVLFTKGADGLTVYQETYDQNRYKEVHPKGKKSDYMFRRLAPARAAAAGFRHISLGVLLGLSPVAEDLSALYTHLTEMEKQFPGAEYSLSFPRLRAVKGQDFFKDTVDDKTFIKIICLSRILFPRVGLNLSTRETSDLRDNALELGITRISAESKTTVGGYTFGEEKAQDPQFDVCDDRSVEDIVTLLKKRRLDPVFTDWRCLS